MGKETPRYRRQRIVGQLTSIVAVFLIGGAAWFHLNHIARYVPLLKNVTDAGPIQVGLDVLTSVLNPANLVPTNVMAGIVTFLFGGIALAIVMRLVATTFRDQVFPNLALRITSLANRIRNWISYRSAMGVGALDSNRTKTLGSLGPRRPGLVQRGLEGVVAATSKERRAPDVVGDSFMDPQLSVEAAKYFAGGNPLPSGPGGAKWSDEQSVKLGENFRNDLDEVTKDCLSARLTLSRVCLAYGIFKNIPPLEDQIVSARRRCEEAKLLLNLAVRAELEPRDGIDQIRRTRQLIAEEADRLKWAQSATIFPYRANGEEMKRLNEAIATLNALEKRYPTAALLDAETRELQLLTKCPDEAKRKPADCIQQIQTAIHALKATTSVESQIRKAGRAVRAR